MNLINLVSRPSCIFCNGSELNTLLTVESFPVYMGTTDSPPELDVCADQLWSTCNRCNGLQLSRLVPIELLYSQNHSDPVGEVWTSHHEEFARFVVKNLGSGTLIEIGGASGKLAREIFKLDSSLHGDYKMIEPDSGDRVEGVALIKGIVEDHLNELAEAGTIVHSHVLEHLYDPILTLKQMANHMEPGARMVLSFPNLERILEQGGANGLNFEHTYFLTAEGLENVVSDAGLNVLSVQKFRGHSIFMSAEKREILTSPPIRVFDMKGATLLQGVWGKARMVAEKFKAELNQRNATSGYLFGAHVFSQSLLRSGIAETEVKGILDNSTSKIGKRLYGTPHLVFHPSQLQGEMEPVVALIASHYQEEIREQLRTINPSVVIVE